MIVKPSRIGHGVRAIEDARSGQRLAELGTVLEVCPGSNIALGVFPGLCVPSLRTLRMPGVRVTISSDDPPFFHTSLKREYELASEAFGFSDAGDQRDNPDRRSRRHSSTKRRGQRLLAKL